MRRYLVLLFLLLGTVTPAQYNVQTLNSSAFMSLQTKNNYQTYFNITLIGNVISASIDTAPKGAKADFNLCQDATGGRTWVWPSTFQNTSTITISAAASACTQASFITPDGTTWNNAGAGSGSVTIATPRFALFIGPNCGLGDPSCIFTPGNAKRDVTASWTAGNSTITTTDSPFSLTDVGKLIRGFTSCHGFLAFANPVGAISTTADVTITGFTDTNHVTVSPTPANNSGGASNACIDFGNSDDAAFDTLSTAVANSVSCPLVFFQANNYILRHIPTMFVNQPASCNVLGSIGGSALGFNFLTMGLKIEGRGRGNTVLELFPSFPGGYTAGGISTCGNGLSAIACLVLQVEAEWREFTWDGGGNMAMPNLNGKVLFEADGPNSIENVTCMNLGGNSSTNSTGLQIQQGWTRTYQFDNNGCGTAGYVVAAGAVAATRAISLSIENSAASAVNVAAAPPFSTDGEPWSLDCYDCQLFQGQVTPATGSLFQFVVRNSGGGRIRLRGGLVNASNTASTAEGVGYYTDTSIAGATTLSVSGTTFGFNNSLGSTANRAISCNNAGSVITLEDARLSRGSTGFTMEDLVGCLWRSRGGNTTPSLSINNSGAGTFIGFQQNDTQVATGNLVLSAGWGSTATKTALSGGDAPIGLTITNSGTGQAANPTITYTFPTPFPVVPLSCTATQTGGTNALLNPFTSSSLTATGVTFTATGTPTASSTEIMQVTCVTL